MDKSKVLLAILLSTLILIGWPFLARKMGWFPTPQRQVQPPPMEEAPQASDSKPPEATSPNAVPAASAKPADAKAGDKTKPAPAQANAQSAQVQTTQAPPRDIVIATDNWQATLSSRGAVATSWILKQQDGRKLTAANNGPLEIIAQEAMTTLGAPFRLRLPWSPDLATQLNQVNFQVEGAQESSIELAPGEQREITFTYTSPTATARKTFKFTGGSFIVEVTADVKANGAEQPVELVLGPRIGDQTDPQNGTSYGNHYQVIGFNREGSRFQIDGHYVTPAFAKITQIDEAAKRIQLDKPLALDIQQIRISGGDGNNFITLVGFARVVERDASNQTLTLDVLPEGVSVGNGVAQSADTLRQGYRWVGVFDRYFGMLAIPPQPVGEIALTNVPLRGGENQPAPHDHMSLAVPVSPDAATHVFVGAKDRELLIALGKRYNADLEAVIDYGMFGFLVRPMVAILEPTLEALYGIFGNFGWAIVVVTALVNLLLFPLRWYSSKKMKQAAKYQPRMKELQEKMKKLKENPKRSEKEMLALQQEQMALMKEANPMGGCLPLVLQMPIFWSFFIFLSISLDMRHAHWLGWVQDLSKPDPYYILPIIMCVTMIASTALMPQPPSADPAMKMQRVMMTWFMPLLLTWLFFLSAPSGLVLYWMISNVVGVAMQLAINKLTAEPQPAGAPSGGAGKNGKDKPRKGGQRSRAEA